MPIQFYHQFSATIAHHGGARSGFVTHSLHGDCLVEIHHFFHRHRAHLAKQAPCDRITSDHFRQFREFGVDQPVVVVHWREVAFALRVQETALCALRLVNHRLNGVNRGDYLARLNSTAACLFEPAQPTINGKHCADVDQQRKSHQSQPGARQQLFIQGVKQATNHEGQTLVYWEGVHSKRDSARVHDKKQAPQTCKTTGVSTIHRSCQRDARLGERIAHATSLLSPSVGVRAR